MFTEQGYSYKADMFSLGAVFYHLLTGKSLFYGLDGASVFEKNKNCDIVSQYHHLTSIASGEACDLFKAIIQPDPSSRPSAREALTHPWFDRDRDIIKQLMVVNQLLRANIEKDIGDLEEAFPLREAGEMAAHNSFLNGNSFLQLKSLEP